MSETTAMTEGWAGALRYALEKRTLRRSIALALVVGCLLSAANQLDTLLTEPFTLRLATKILVNFLIPFAVSSLSAVISRQRGPH